MASNNIDKEGVDENSSIQQKEIDQAKQNAVSGPLSEESEASFVQNLETVQAENLQQQPPDSSDFASIAVLSHNEEVTDSKNELQKDKGETKVTGNEDNEEKKNSADAEAPATQITEPSNNIVTQDRESQLEEQKREEQEEAKPEEGDPDGKIALNELDGSLEVVEGPTLIKPTSTTIDDQLAPISNHLEASQQEQHQEISPATEQLLVNKTPVSRPILSQVSTMDQVLSKKLPKLRANIQEDDPGILNEMVIALEQKQSVFEQAFITVKQEHANESGGAPDAAGNDDERIDMIPATQTDKVIAYLSKELPMDMTTFSRFFKTNYSQINDSADQTITLAQFTQAYIEYIEVTHKSSQKSDKQLSSIDNEGDTAQQKGGGFIFGENFYILKHDLMSEKLAENTSRIQKIFSDIGEDEDDGSSKLPLGRLREFWLHMTLVTKSVMVMRGTEYKLGQRVMDDPECLNLLQKHVYSAWAQSESESQELKMTQTEFEAAFSSDPLQFDDYKVSSEFLLNQIETFFLQNRQVILVDLQALENKQPIVNDEAEEQKVKQIIFDQSTPNEHLNLDLQAENIAIKAASPKLQKDPIHKKQGMKIVKSKKQTTVAVDPFGDRPPKHNSEELQAAGRYVEKDASYVPSPSQLPDDRQKIIDNNLLEVFNFYCRKFAQVRGDFTQKNQNLIVLGLQGFTRFSKDFKVPLSNAELTTVWKKSSNNHQPHDFEQFQKSIALLGVTLNKSTQEKITVRQKQLKKEVKRRKDIASAETSDKAAVVVNKPLKTAVEKMTDQEIQGELILLPRQIGRISILTEDQSRIQMYEHLEMEHPERYRPKLPVSHQNELNSNILLTKKLLISGDGTSSQAGGSKVSQSAVSNMLARLSSNPPVKDRASLGVQRNNKDFVKDMRPVPAARGKTQTRPVSLLSPAPSIQKLETIKKQMTKEKIENPLLPVSSHSQIVRDALTGRNEKNNISSVIPVNGAFQRKKTEFQKQGPAMHSSQLTSPAPSSSQKLKEIPIRKTVSSPTQQDRNSLAEIHKRIRQEKQSTGRVLSVAEAKQILEEEKKGGLNRKSSVVSIKSKTGANREKMSPSKMLPLSQINKGKQRNVVNHLVNKTPSMIDLNPQSGNYIIPKIEEKLHPLPDSLTFDDIQKMHLTSLNRFGSKEDEFRPQDFLDLDSQDSENEILAKFKPAVLPESMLTKPGDQNEMLSLMQPSSPLKQFAPPYIATSNMIDEQTGYSNSPKFSIYRLNNQSNMGKDASGFEDQMLTGNMQATHHLQNQSQLYSQEFFPHTGQAVSSNNNIDQMIPQPISDSNFSIKVQSQNKQPSSRAIRQSTKSILAVPNTRASANPHAVPITTPQSQKAKVGGHLLSKNVPLVRNLGGGRRSNNQSKINGQQQQIQQVDSLYGDNNQYKEADGGIFESHIQLPFAGQDQVYMDGQVTPLPHLSINENISEIGINQKNNADQITSLGDISMFNDGGNNINKKVASSPVRRPAQQIIDDQRSILSKHNSGAQIGEGLTVKPPTLTNSRHKLKVGSARISTGAIHNSQTNPNNIIGSSSEAVDHLIPDGVAVPASQGQINKRRLGQLAQGKRSLTKPAGNKPKTIPPPRYTTSAKKPQDGKNGNPSAAIRMSTDANSLLAVANNQVGEGADPLLIRHSSQIVGGINNNQMMPSQELKSLLPPQLNRDIDGLDSTNNGSRQAAKSNSAVSSSNQRSLMRAQEVQKKESQNKQRRMDGLMNLHEQNLQKGLSAVSRR